MKKKKKRAGLVLEIELVRTWWEVAVDDIPCSSGLGDGSMHSIHKPLVLQALNTARRCSQFIEGFLKNLDLAHVLLKQKAVFAASVRQIHTVNDTQSGIMFCRWQCPFEMKTFDGLWRHVLRRVDVVETFGQQFIFIICKASLIVQDAHVGPLHDVCYGVLAPYVLCGGDI